MINQKLLDMLIRQVKSGKIKIEDIKDEIYRAEVEKAING